MNGDEFHMRKSVVEEEINVDDKTYTLELMTQFVKRRLDEITKVNLYDIGLSEEELKRRKNKKKGISFLRIKIWSYNENCHFNFNS